MTDATLLEKYEEMSTRVPTLETENTRLQNENRLLRQKLDQYIRHYFGGQRKEGLDKHQLELLLQGFLRSQSARFNRTHCPVGAGS